MVKYTAGSNKGQTKRGDLINSPFALGKPEPDYTSSRVVENIDVSATEFTPAWTPVVGDKVELRKAADSTWEEKALTEGKVAITAGTYNAARYVYDNIVIPQNDLPIINAEIVGIPVVAEAHRVAIYYSQIAAYEAKQDYGFDLGDALAKQAVGKLSYDIDTKITDKLVEIAEVLPSLTFNKAPRNGVSKAEQYEEFAEVIGDARAHIYAQTNRFMANYMIIGPDLVSMLPFLKGFKGSNVQEANGPYFAGTLDGFMKIFVKPNMPKGEFLVGVNGDDMQSSALVYAPYMAIVPTQALGYADGGISQGWSTLFALEVLNKQLVVAGTVTNDPSKQVVITKAAD